MRISGGGRHSQIKTPTVRWRGGSHMKRVLLSALLAATATAPTLRAAEVRQLTLPEAVDLALKQNRSLKLARLHVQDVAQSKVSARSQYFPTVRSESTLWHVTELERLLIPSNAFGAIPGGAGIPPHNILLDQGRETFETSGTSINQPITQLLRIRGANKAAEADVASSRSDEAKAEVDVALEAHEMYYALLVAQLNRRAQEQQIAYSEEALREDTDQVRMARLCGWRRSVARQMCWSPSKG